jgi:hypothetical protein
MKRLLVLFLILASLSATPSAWAADCYTWNPATGAWAWNTLCGPPQGGGSVIVPSGKTAVIGNSLTFFGTDGSTLNVGAGGTLGSAAYTPASAYTPYYSILNTLGNLPNIAGYLYNDGFGHLSYATGGAMVYPGAGIPYSTGAAWGSSYSPSNPIPFSYLTGVQPAGSYVTQSTTVNSHPLSSNVTVSASDVGLGNVLNVAQEPALGNPSTNGSLLSSTTGGVRSWVANGGRVLLNTLTASGSASLSDTTSLTATYSEYEIVFENIIPASNGVVFEMTVQSGGSWESSSYSYTWQKNNAGGSGANGTGSAAFASIGGTWSNALANVGYGSGTAAGLSGSLRVSNPSSTSAPKNFIGMGFSFTDATNSNNLAAATGAAQWYGGNGAITGVSFQMSTGNITSGTIKIYGWN